MNRTHKLTTNFTMHQNNFDRVVGTGFGRVSPEALFGGNADPTYLSTTRWTWAASSRLLFEATASYQRSDLAFTDPEENGIARVPFRDLATGLRSGTSILQNFRTEDHRRNVQASVSYVTGSHNFKAGLGMQNNVQYGQWQNNGDIFEAWTIFGAPSAVLVMGNGDLEDERKMNCDCGLYAQDSWTVDRFTLNLGVRYDWFNNSLAGGHLPAGWFTPEITADPIEDLPDWRDWNGRLGVAYDLFGDGRTAVKAFAGRYVANEALGIATTFSPFGSNIDYRFWSDLNGDGTVINADGTPQVAEIRSQDVAAGCRGSARRRRGARTEGPRRHADVDAAAVEGDVLRHEAHRADLHVGTHRHPDAHHRAQPDGDAVAEAHPARLHEAALDGVPGEVHVAADHHVVAELQQVVVAHPQAVHVHAAPHPGPVQAQVGAPDGRPPEERASEQAHDVGRDHVAHPVEHRPVQVGQPHRGVRPRPPARHPGGRRRREHQHEREEHVRRDDREARDHHPRGGVDRGPREERRPQGQHRQDGEAAHDRLHDHEGRHRPGDARSPDVPRTHGHPVTTQPPHSCRTCRDAFGSGVDRDGWLQFIAHVLSAPAHHVLRAWR